MILSDMVGWDLAATSPTPTSLPWRLHRLKLLRHWLLYFCHTLHQHFTSCVLLPFSHRVQEMVADRLHVQDFRRGE